VARLRSPVRTGGDPRGFIVGAVHSVVQILHRHATTRHQEEQEGRSGTGARDAAGRRGRIEERCERYSKRSTG
jgi:hypothetical protein